MASVHDDPVVVNWELIDVVPNELLDPFADDATLGLLGVEPEPMGPAEPALPLAEWLDAQASYYRSLRGPLARWTAELFDAKARDARRHKATTPDELDERARFEEYDHDYEQYTKARADGYDAASRDYFLDGRHSTENLALMSDLTATRADYQNMRAERDEAAALAERRLQTVHQLEDRVKRLRMPLD